MHSNPAQPGTFFECHTCVAGLTKFVFLFGALLASTVAFAADYDSDFTRLKEAAELDVYPTADLDRFADPNFGPFRDYLDEENAPWTGNYFPLARGGLATRWRRKTDRIPQPDAVPDLNPRKINSLSPAEKYDLLLGDYTFSFTKRMLKTQGPFRPAPPVAGWEGYCNGMRCAGILFEEPVHPVDVVNPDGIKIRFYPADIKALAAASYQYVQKYVQIGASPINGTVARRPNPAVFDMLLRYFIGSRKKPFSVNAHLGSEVWNENVVGYNRRITFDGEPTKLEKERFPWAVKKRRYELTVWTVGDVKIQKSNGVTKENHAEPDADSKSLNTGYTLFLDESGKARGGVWKRTRSKRGVGFVWFARGPGREIPHALPARPDEIKFNAIAELVSLSAKGPTGPVKCSDIVVGEPPGAVTAGAVTAGTATATDLPGIKN